MKSSPKINWGIVATGSIAHQFADALAVIPEANLQVVFSRKMETARDFAEEYSVPHFTNRMEEFLATPGLDVVYVATPHNYHIQAVLACLNADIHVLCEKPMGINKTQVEAMVTTARQKNVFLMEAMWTHCYPGMAKVLELVNDGAIGDIRQIKSDFCFRGDWNPKGRHLNLDLAGGSLLDLGVYNIFLSQLICGVYPTKITGDAFIGETGVDEQAAFVLQYPGGILSLASCSVQTETVQEAYIYGTKGHIHIPKFWQPDQIELVKGDKTETFHFKRFGNGYTYEVLEVHQCLMDGKKESSVVPHKRSLEVVEIMDTLRAQWNLTYPGE